MEASTDKIIIEVQCFPDTNKVSLNGKLLDPKRSQKIRNHSPDGFSWGYGGSGPAQLALAILLECTTEELAKKHYQLFKWTVIANIPQGQHYHQLIDITQFTKP